MHYNAVDQVTESDASFDRLRICLEPGDQSLSLRTVSITELRVIKRDHIFAAIAEQPQALLDSFPFHVAFIYPFDQLIGLATAVCDRI
jgi:hypothetical protein